MGAQEIRRLKQRGSGRVPGALWKLVETNVVGQALRLPSAAKSIRDKQSRVADVYTTATKTQSQLSALVYRLGEPVLHFRARNYVPRSSDRCDRLPRLTRKPRVESMSRSETAS